MNRQRGALLDAEQGAAGGPESVEVVVFAGFAVEEVDDDGVEVEELPAAFGAAFAAGARGAGDFAEGVFECAEVAAGGGGGDDEVVGEVGEFGDFEEDDGFGLALGEFDDDCPRQPLGVEGGVGWSGVGLHGRQSSNGAGKVVGKGARDV